MGGKMIGAIVLFPIMVAHELGHYFLAWILGHRPRGIWLGRCPIGKEENLPNPGDRVWFPWQRGFNGGSAVFPSSPLPIAWYAIVNTMGLIVTIFVTFEILVVVFVVAWELGDIGGSFAAPYLDHISVATMFNVTFKLAIVTLIVVISAIVEVIIIAVRSASVDLADLRRRLRK